MITIAKIENTRINPDERLDLVELRGLSTDDKPTQINGREIDNGSVYIEIDTGKLFLFDKDNEEWKEV